MYIQAKTRSVGRSHQGTGRALNPPFGKGNGRLLC